MADGYTAIKALVKRKFGKDSEVIQAIAACEDNPELESNQQALANHMAEVKAERHNDLLQACLALKSALQQTSDGKNALCKYEIKIDNSKVGIIGDNPSVQGGINF